MEFISRSELLKLFDISVWTIRRWQKNNHFPCPISASGKIKMYRKSEVKEWLESQGDKSKNNHKFDLKQIIASQTKNLKT